MNAKYKESYQEISNLSPSNLSDVKARLKAWVGSAPAGLLLRTGRVTGGTGVARAQVRNLTDEPPVPGCGLTTLIDGDGLGKN